MVAKLSQYEIQFSEAESADFDLQENVRAIHVQSQLGRSSTLQLALALKPEEIKKLKLSTLPKKIVLKWGGKVYFSGEATEFQVTGHSQVQVTYHDVLHRLEKMYTETETKQQKMKAFLEKLVSQMESKPSLSFHTNDLFEEELPTFSLGYRTIQDVLNEMGKFYGFTYFIRPDKSESKPSLHFLRAGSGINPSPIPTELKDTFGHFTTSHSVLWKYDTVTVGLTDGLGENKKKALKAGCIREPLGGFDEGSKMKAGFEITLPELDIPVSHPELYERAEKILPYQYVQKHQFTDAQTFTMTQPKLQIGDCFQVTDGFAEFQNDAVYLVQATELVIQSTMPRLRIKAIRP